MYKSLHEWEEHTQQPYTMCPAVAVAMINSQYLHREAERVLPLPHDLCDLELIIGDTTTKK